MSVKPEKPKMTSPKPSKAERGKRRVIVEHTGKAEMQDHDLVHAEGGTVGLGEGDDLNLDD
ncbi:hypothetical protein [Bradyrhizobium embrapense]|uniref:hypothetical protein n=1 Tax=Bradyrhizobium embrapense TaxID=630921 RepID=UPI000AED7B01|nr:hypothetical protein [Bradyrhizobium embrapense]